MSSIKYRKKPIVIEAMEFTDENKDQVHNWVTCTTEVCFDKDGNPTLKIATLEGDHLARFGDFIIKGIAGEFYPCRADIFEATYEKVE